MTMSTFMAGLLVMALWVLRPADKKTRGTIRKGLMPSSGISINIYQQTPGALRHTTEAGKLTHTKLSSSYDITDD